MGARESLKGNSKTSQDVNGNGPAAVEDDELREQAIIFDLKMRRQRILG